MDVRVNSLGQPIGNFVMDWVSPELPGKVSLEGGTCLLEPLDPDAHAEGLYSAFAEDKDGKNWTYLPYGPFHSFDEFFDWLDSVCSGDDPQFYTIKLKTTGDPVGVASYLRIDPKNGSIEVGHIHFSQLMKQSIVATEAMYLMMKLAFDLGYRRYEWKCDAFNAPSRSAAQRLGFSFEGVFRNAVVYKGRSRDTAWFSVIDSEWPSLNTVFLRWLHSDNFDSEGRQILSLRSLTEPILKDLVKIK